MSLYLLAALAPISAAVAYLATPLSASLARAIGAIDLPDGARKRHPRATARLGGLALLLALASVSLPLASRGGLPLALLPGLSLICAVGVADDVLSLPPTLKLALQGSVAAVSALLLLPSPTLPHLLGGALWICLLTNAFNFIDGSDGLAAGQGAVGGAILAVLLLTSSALGIAERPVSSAALTALLLSAACVGFLPHNRERASVFLGDTGSMLIGHALGALSLSAPAAVAPTVLLAPHALPLADLVFAILRRARRGVSIFEADRGHVHHRMADAGYAPHEIAIILCTVSLAVGALGLASLMRYR